MATIVEMEVLHYSSPVFERAAFSTCITQGIQNLTTFI